VHRVVVILGIRRIDGDQRDVAPVLAPLQIGRLRRFGFALCRGAELQRDVVRVDRDQADRLLRRLGAVFVTP
jgi:hypothetical protein